MPPYYFFTRIGVGFVIERDLSIYLHRYLVVVLGLKAKRSNLKIGAHSRAMIIPAQLEIGDESTIAANRLGLVDFRGVIPEKDLLEFLESHIEPA